MNKTISFAQAWAHVAHSPAYWIWIVVVLILSGVFAWANNKYDFGTAGKVAGIVALFFALGFAILFRPAEVAANTSIDAASRGVYIGY